MTAILVIGVRLSTTSAIASSTTLADVLRRLSQVAKQDVSKADIGQPKPLVAPDPDIIVVIATTDELGFLGDLVQHRRSLHEQSGGGSAEYQLTFNRKVSLPGLPAPKKPAIRLLVLGAQGELVAATVLMAVLDRIRAAPKLIVSLGTAGALSRDVRLGDVVVSKQVDRYLEQARIEDAKGENGLATKYFEVICSGDVMNTAANAGQCVHLETESKREIAKLRKEWKEACVKDSKKIMTDVPRAAAIEASLINAEPILHCGPTASGPLLVDSLNFKTHLQKNRNRHHLCVDMESGGVLAAASRAKNGCEAIVIRTPCDFGDGRKKTNDAGESIADMPENAYRKVAMRNGWRAFTMLLQTGYFARKS